MGDGAHFISFHHSISMQAIKKAKNRTYVHPQSAFMISLGHSQG